MTSGIEAQPPALLPNSVAAASLSGPADSAAAPLSFCDSDGRLSARNDAREPRILVNENKPTTRAIIFDLDGVLISSVDLHWYAYRKTFAAEGLEFSRERYLEVGIGAPREKVIRRVLGEIPEDKLKFLMAEKERYVYEFLENQTLDAIPGSLEFLRRARARDLKTAVATASRTPLPFLKAIGALDEFDLVLDRSMVTHPKPHPEIYVLAAQTLKLRASETLVVEDSPIGVAAARAAGMRTLAVTTTHTRDELNEATLIVDSFDEINLDHWIK